MKKEEVDYLDIVKHSNGLDDYGSKKEIRSFIDTQKGFRLLKKECMKKETLIKNLEKKITILKDKLSKEKSNNLKLKQKDKNIPVLKTNTKLGQDIFSEDISKKEQKDIIKYSKRIIHNIEDKSYTMTDFYVELMIPKRYIDKCVSYLINKHFLESRIINGVMRYSKI